VISFSASHNLVSAHKLLIIPVLYGIWVIFSLIKAIHYKYDDNISSKEAKTEIAVLLFSLTPWIGLPIITFFDQSQAIEASITNIGFLLLFALQVKRHIYRTRTEHQRLIDSELSLLDWNTRLQQEVDKRTKELEQINEQKTNNFINLVHETKTPLTLINNYLEDYINKYGSVKELDFVKRGVDKLTNDITSLFDIERFIRGFDVYNHNQISNFSEVLKTRLTLFDYYCQKQSILCKRSIEENVLIKADPNAIDR